MIKKLKYIFLVILSSFVFAFITLLMGKNYINILGTTIDNTLGSYPVQLDYDNYEHENLIGFEDQEITLNNYNVKIENGVVTTSGTATANTLIKVKLLQKIKLKSNVNYYYSLFNSPNGVGNIAIIPINDINLGWDSNLTRIINVSSDTDFDSIYFYCALNSTCENTIKPVLKTENYANEFIHFLTFGYNVDLAINYTPAGFHNFNTIIKLNDNICFNKTISTLNDTTYFRIKNACFIPFDLNSSGYFSLENTSLSVEMSADSGVTSIDWQSGFILTPTLKGYYKGEYVDDVIYLKNNYLSNAFFYNGFTARVEGNIISSPEPNIPSLFIMQNNTLGGVYRLNGTNQFYNLVGQQIENTSFVNFIDLKNDMNFTIGFDFGENTSFSSINKLKYVFSFSGINSIVLGNVGSTSPLPDNVTTFNKYNRCSAWYDIPCQLGNGLTYVIYEAPIISPILTFVVSFITMFSSLVSFVELFKGFGIVFGCFVIYMFINLLHKYSK